MLKQIRVFKAIKHVFGKKAEAQKIIVRNYTPRRALMYVPGDDLKKLNKAFSLEVDCIAMDCEDGVALNRKSAARDTIRQILDNDRPKTPKKNDLGVRINGMDTILFEDDLKAVLTAKNLPDTISLPKVEEPEHISWFSDKLTQYLKTDQQVNLIIYIESAVAFLNLESICRKAVKLGHKRNKFEPVCLVFGSDDFCASVGITRTEDSSEVLYARQKLVLTAKAFNLQAIDMVYIKYKDLEGLKRQSEEGARMGYTGKQVIHPGQVPIVQNAFLPDSKQVEWATGLLESFQEHQKSGKGAFTYQGSMIDMPTMRQAQNIVDLINYNKKE